MSLDELTASFNREFGENKTREQVKSTLKNHRFTCGRKTGSINKGVSKLFSPEQVDFIKREYSGRSRKELTSLFNEHFDESKKLSQIVAFVKNNKIKSGLTGHFTKGCKSWNAGTIGVVKPNSGNFQKGHVPANLNPVGHERICVKDGYVLVKVDQVNPYTGHRGWYRGWYRAKHVVNWELVNGPVPEGMNLRFIDGDQLNPDVDNLELVSKALHLRLNKNKLNAAPDEYKSTIRAISQLEVKTFDRLRD